MRRILHVTKYHIVKPVFSTGRMVVNANIELWGRAFGEAWEPLPMDKKIAWILVLNNTIAILTLIEFFLLKKR